MTAIDVRDLLGEDLTDLPWADEDLRVRSLGEASVVAARADEVDVLAACAGGHVVGVAAVGHGTGEASMASVSIDPAWADRSVTPRLVRSLERRAAAVDVPLLRVHVEARDAAARALFERLGYEVVGAGTLSWEEPSAGAGATVRHVDSWVLHKRLEPAEPAREERTR